MSKSPSEIRAILDKVWAKVWPVPHKRRMGSGSEHAQVARAGVWKLVCDRHGLVPAQIAMAEEVDESRVRGAMRRYDAFLRMDERRMWEICRAVYDDPAELRRRFVEGAS